MTRFLPLTVAWIWLLPFVAGAQIRYQPRNQPGFHAPNCEAPAPTQPSCEAGQPTCAPQPNCAAQPPCKPPCQQPEQPLMYMQPQQGVFVQPPASGTVQGPVEQSGIEGPTVTFPELSLRFPSIRFPGVSRTRQNARMITDRQIAPWQEMPAAPMMPMAPAAAPIAAAPVPQMMMAPAAAPQMMMMAQPQMMMAPVQMAPQQFVPQQQYVPQQQLAPPPLQVPQPPPEEPPLAPRAPSCDARGNPLAGNSAEDKIRQLELVEQQLKQRMELLRRQLEQIEMSQRPPVPAPDLGARAVQPSPAKLPAAQPQRQPGVQPISQPVAPPGQAAVRIYNERPAAYISEPHYQPPPAPQIIREPRSPSATITGLHPR